MRRTLWLAIVVLMAGLAAAGGLHAGRRSWEPAAAARTTPTCGDPQIIYSTLIGGDLAEAPSAVVLAEDGRAWFSGTTSSNTFPAPPDRALRHGIDPLLVGLTAAGDALTSVLWIYPAELNAEDYGTAVGRDAAGNLYVAGHAFSPDLCAALGDPGGYDTTYNGGGDGYIVRVNPAGTVDRCTFLGGDSLDRLNGMAVTASGELYVTGGTWSDDFPATAGSAGGQRDLYVAQFSRDLMPRYVRRLGGSLQEEGMALALTADGGAVVTGWSFSADFPTTAGALDRTANGGVDAVVLALTPGGDVRFATYLGGSDEDRGYALALDDAGRATLTGVTASADFPTTADAFDRSYDDGAFGGDAFVVQLAADGSALRYATYLGGTAADQGLGIAVRQADNIYVTGGTLSADFPLTADALGDRPAGGTEDAFVVRLRPGEATLRYATRLGGTAAEAGYALAVDVAGTLTLVGSTRSDDFCTSTNAYDRAPNGDDDIFALRLRPGGAAGLLPTPTPVPPANELYLPYLERARD